MARCLNCIHFDVCDTDRHEKERLYGDCCDFLNDADVVEVVRCKDCVNRVEFDTNKFHCELTGYYCGEMGYCSDAVRTPKERGGEK